MKRITRQTLLEVRDWLVAALLEPSAGGRVRFEVPDPDLGAGRYAGELFAPPTDSGESGPLLRHRGYAAWVELAELLGCRLCTPRGAAPARSVDRDASGGEGDHFVTLTFERIDETDSFHDETAANEKYGAASRFARIDKRELASHALALEASFARVALPAGARVLALGVNRGDELALLERTVGVERFASFEIVGVDHSASALEQAAARFAAHPTTRLACCDINDIGQTNGMTDPLDGERRFDLLLAVGTLHSPGVRESKALLMHLVQEHIAARGALILGFPNCRHAGGEVLYGARMRNSPHPDLALVVKEIDVCKRYLQQHRFRLTVTGKHYLLLTATRIGLADRPA